MAFINLLFISAYLNREQRIAEYDRRFPNNNSRVANAIRNIQRKEFTAVMAIMNSPSFRHSRSAIRNKFDLAFPMLYFVV
jgi:hypothetical protein